jgi:hypothetical protein
MTMNRVIHAAVRRDLARLESALAAAADGDLARANQLHVAYANLHRQLKHHHEGEDAYVFPFLERLRGQASWCRSWSQSTRPWPTRSTRQGPRLTRTP